MAMSRSFGAQAIDNLAADLDFSCRDILQPGQHSQQGGLTAARWSNKDDEFAIFRS